jgi:hypothetical protein
MRQSRLLLLALLILIMNNGCKETRIQQDEYPTSIHTPNPVLDMSCRQTIQKLYSIESYCPNNLTALQQLFTENFNQQYPPSLNRCNEVSKYSITKLLSQNEIDFPTTMDHANLAGTLLYYVEIEVESKSGMALGNNPTSGWIYMKVDEVGQCKIDRMTGGR